MTWSIRARMTGWYSLVVVAVLITGAVAVALVQQRLALARLDGELQRLMLTLEGVMRTEFGEGLDLQAAADEASIEVVAPDRTLALTRPDGTLLAMWGLPLASDWRPSKDRASLNTIVIDSKRLRLFSHPVVHEKHRYVAAALAPLEALEAEHEELWLALAIGIVLALAVAGAGGWLVGRKTLQPLKDLAVQATAISEQQPTEHLRTPNIDDEVGQFASAFNGLLDRLAAVLHAQRQFMADASHELRTPVSVLRTTAQVTLARDHRPEADYRESLTIVAEQSARLTRLVDALFLLARAEANGIPLTRQPLYLDDLVAECARAARVVATARGINVQDGGDDAVSFSGDDMLLRQMIGNLLDNGIRHASPGGAVTAIVTGEQDRITIRVKDDGRGVPPEERERIFQRFVRLDGHQNGAGLGLPIARWIAEAHGGQLVLESSSPEGSCFAVTLPRA